MSYPCRVITVVAVDGEGAQGSVATFTVTFDRTCLVLPSPPILTLATQEDVDKMAACSSLTSTRVNIIRSATDPILSLRPMRDITVSSGSETESNYLVVVYKLVIYVHNVSVQSMGDLFISGLTELRDLSGLENLAQYGPELSIVNNQKLTTTVHLSANVTSDSAHFLSLTNVGVRSNPLLRDLDGLSLISTVTGKTVR